MYNSFCLALVQAKSEWLMRKPAFTGLRFLVCQFYQEPLISLAGFDHAWHQKGADWLGFSLIH